MPELTFKTSVLLDSAALAAQPAALAGLPEGVTMRALRRLDDGTLRSVLLDIPGGWRSGSLAGGAAQQGYVTAGTLSEGATALPAGRFFFHPAGHSFDWHSAAGATVILILDGPQRYAAAVTGAARPDAVVALDPQTVPVTPSLIDGKPSGVIRRVLWQDPETGADTRHLTIPKGVSGLGAEWHPCNEEIFCLTRETVEGDAHPFQPGWFLFNPAYAVHGGNRTVNAAETTLLEWHDGLWEIHRYSE